MKKLIALTLSLALILSFSFAVMAAPVALVNLGTAGTDDNGTQSMSTTFDVDTMTFVTTVTGVTDQATLLVFSGDTLTTTGDTNIQFIDQITVGTTTEFTYKLKADPEANEQFTIKVGGSNLTTPLSQYVKPIEQAAPTGYTVSGTVSNAAEALPLLDYIDAFGDETVGTEFVTKCDSAWVTKVKLIPEIQLHRIIKNIYDSATYPTDTSVPVVPAVTVDPVAKTFSMSEVPNGTYWLVFERTGFVTLFSKVVVADDDVDLGEKLLIAGDLYTSKDLVIDASDTISVFSSSASFDDPAFNEQYDLTADTSVDASDTITVLQNSGFDYSGTDSDFYELDLEELLGYEE